MSRRASRFEKLEKRRTGSAPTQNRAARERFDALEGRGETPAESVVPAAAGDRFRPPAERLPEVEAGPEGAQPFVRCARCETDNTVYAESCVNCQAELDTPEQRAFNEQLWAARREEAAREERERALHRQEQEGLSAENGRVARALAEALAREVGERERARLDLSWATGGRWSWGGPPLGIRLLQGIRSPRWRVVLIASAVGLPALLAILGERRAALAAFLLALAFFLSPTRFRPGV